MVLRLKALPPEKAVEFFRQKGYKIGFDHRDVWQAEHQAAFTVAKAMSLDLLRDIRDQVDAAIAQGTTFEAFKAALKPNLVKRGWWGRALMTDPATGETREVQLGSTRRLKVIYDTNLRQAHSEGQWVRIQEAKASLPYLMYDHTPSPHERKEHAAWDGLVLPVDDPWWQAHYPVRAWGCKCRVIQVGSRQLERLGARVGTAPPERYDDYVNRRTGERSRIPAGVDPEFAYPPGGRRANLVGFLAARLERLQAELRPAAARALAGEPFAAWMQAPVGSWPIAVMPAAHVAQLGAQSDVVRLSADTMEKQLRSHADLAAADYARVQDVLETGEVIYESAREVVFLVDEPGGFVAVVKATRTGRALFLTSFRRLSGEDAKRDKEVQRLRAKGK